MASKKLKKALIAGLGAAALSKIGQAKQMKTFLAEEGGDRAKVNYITKKAKPIKKTFMGNVKDATKKVIKENINLGRGPGIKPTDTLAGDYGDAFSDVMGIQKGAKAGKMIKARGGKLVNLKPTKLY
jgi:hypothetical protein